VSRDKVKLYMLDRSHEGGGADKARLWASTLGYEGAHVAQLQADLMHAARRAEVLDCGLTPYGMQWKTRALMLGPNGREHPVRMNWVTLAPGTAPRLITAWPDI
jgi:hypothetical protein